MPDVTEAFDDWVNYRPTAHVVRARRMETAFTIESARGLVAGDTGDYLLIDLDGQPRAVAAAVFEQTYEVNAPRPVMISGVGGIESQERFGRLGG